jgi:hypothetical protein
VPAKGAGATRRRANSIISAENEADGHLVWCLLVLNLRCDILVLRRLYVLDFRLLNVLDSLLLLLHVLHILWLMYRVLVNVLHWR